MCIYKGFSKQYSADVEPLILIQYGRLSEQARRQYACLQVVKLGYESKDYIQKLLGIGQKTIELGLRGAEYTDFMLAW